MRLSFKLFSRTSKAAVAMAGQFVEAVAILGLLGCIVLATPQRAAYSLQAAVDELHRREAAKYPLNAPPPSAHFAADQLDDWDEGESVS